MSGFQRGPTGGGGVRPRQNEPPRSSGGGGGYPNSGGYGERDRSQPDHTVAEYWPGYLQGGYFEGVDAKGLPILKVQYVSRCIPGDELLPNHQQHGVEPLVQIMANSRPPKDGLTTGQLRRFFMHCRGLESRLKSGAQWADLRPRFQFLDAAAADAHGKQDQKIPGIFYDFIRRNVAAVKTKEDFLRGFLPHFEALVGFASALLKKERN